MNIMALYCESMSLQWHARCTLSWPFHHTRNRSALNADIQFQPLTTLSKLGSSIPNLGLKLGHTYLEDKYGEMS